MTDADLFAPLLRKADIEEVKASSGLSPLESLRYSIAHSEECWVLEIDNNPIAIFGVGATQLFNIPWMLGTNGIDRYPKEFMKTSYEVVATWFQKYPLLMNFVDARNTVAIRWLIRIGFKLIRELTYGVENKPFIQFARIQDV